MDDTYVKPFQVKAGNYGKMSMTDTGIGMDEKTQEKVFDPFFSTKEMGRGTGLGLASAYGIIKNHDGIINVYSEVGHGTTFCIYLPAVGRKPLEEERKPITVSKGRGSLLLVDDEEFILDIARQMLESLGYNVFVAGNGQAAVDVYREHRDQIQLVILDMIMPCMNGLAAFEQLQKVNPNVKVLIASGYSINEDIKQALNRGCRGFIQKPFDIVQLSSKVTDLLRQ
jgi:CheY-like chemotaxis protein